MKNQNEITLSNAVDFNSNDLSKKYNLIKVSLMNDDILIVTTKGKMVKSAKIAFADGRVDVIPTGKVRIGEFLNNFVVREVA